MARIQGVLPRARGMSQKRETDARKGGVITETNGSVARVRDVAGAGNGRAKRDVGAETRGAITRARVVSEADV